MVAGTLLATLHAEVLFIRIIFIFSSGRMDCLVGNCTALGTGDLPPGRRRSKLKCSLFLKFPTIPHIPTSIRVDLHAF
jgi:hypothetical protein